MTNDSKPAPQGYDFLADVEGARSVAHIIESNVGFQTTLNALARLEQNLLELPGRLQYLHECGVTYDLTLGESIGRLNQRLRVVAEDARAIATRYEEQLRPRSEALWDTIHANDEKIGADGFEAHADKIAAALNESEQLKARLERAEQDIQGAFNETSNEMRTLLQKVAQLERTADELKVASWKPQSNELIIKGSEAAYHRRSDEKQKGYLFLTTERLVFERREEVESGMLFMKRKKQVNEISFETPTSQITAVAADSNQLSVSHAQGAAEFTLHNNAAEWETLLTRSAV